MLETLSPNNPAVIQAVLRAAEKKKAEPHRRFSLQYRDDPVAFVHDCIRWHDAEKPAEYQEEVMGALEHFKRVCVRSPHGAGKTSLSAWVVLWFALTRDGEDWKIPTTASAWRQLTKFLWPEIHKWARRLNWYKIPREPFDSRTELLSLNLKLRTGEAFAVASDTPDLIEGAHAEHLLYLFDESKAIPHGTFDAAEGAFSTASRESEQEAMALAVSTPGDRSGRFYDIQSKKPGYEDWWVRHIKLEEAIRAGRVTEEWVEQRRKQWGQDSPVFQARVLGEFPEQGTDTLVNIGWIETARQNELVPTGVRRAGLDIARFGEDDSVELFVMDGREKGQDREADDKVEVYQNGCVMGLESWQGHDLMQTAGRVIHNEVPVYTDTIGVGAGVHDRLQELQFSSTPINVGEAAGDSEHFLNLRAELYWKLREQFRDSQIDLTRLAQADYDRLMGELAAIKYEYTSKGQIKIEPKEELKKRLNGASPDFADALMLSRSAKDYMFGIHVI